MNLSFKSEEEIIQLLQSKNKDEFDFAFIHVYEKYSKRIFSYCYKSLGSEQKADDIFQDTFLKFLERVKKGEIKSILGLLIITARNLILNHKRDKKNFIQIEDNDFSFFDEHQFEIDEVKEIIIKSLDLIDEKLKEALILRYYSDLDYDEISEILSISKGNARARVFRAKIKLKDIIKPYLDELNKKV